MSYTKTTWVESETPLSAANMNNIENGVLAAHEILDVLVDNIYPVGSILMSTSPANPKTRALFANTTWVAWGSGRVPVGVNASDSAFNTVEETGGSKDAIIPAHNHTATFSGTAVAAHTHTGPSHSHTMSHTHSGPAHTHTANGGANYFLSIAKSPDNIVKRISAVTSVSGSGISTVGKTTNVLQSDNSIARLDTTGTSGTGNTGAASTSSTGSAGTGNTGSAGGHTPAGTVTVASKGETVTNKNLQPYITCYMWKRTA